jgi:hypothetical protein
VPAKITVTARERQPLLRYGRKLGPAINVILAEILAAEILEIGSGNRGKNPVGRTVTAARWPPGPG